MLEKEIEKKLVKAIEEKKGLCLKFNSLSRVGMPDRLILMDNNRIAFIELKSKGRKPRPIQKKRIAELEGLGFKCFVIDDVDQIEGVVNEI